MSAIARQQEQMREAMQQTMGSLMPPGFEEMRRQNIAMMERAMGLFSPFYRAPSASPEVGAGEPGAPDGVASPEQEAAGRIEALQREVEHLRLMLASKAEAAPAPPAAPASPPPAKAKGNAA